MMNFDFVSYKNQLEACRKTFGLVPHPAFERLEAPSGQPMTTPWIVCAVGRPGEKAKPANYYSLATSAETTTPCRVSPFPSFDVEPPLPSIPDARGIWRDFEFTETDAEEIRRCEDEARRRTLPRAEIKSVWTEYDVRLDGHDGIMIHAQFRTANLENEELSAIASFYFDGTERPVESAWEAFSTSDGTLCVSYFFRPRYRNTLFRDLQMFLPLDAFRLQGNGLWRLKFEVVIRRSEPTWAVLAQSPWQHFEITLTQ
jgi:hypothetical protein